MQADNPRIDLVQIPAWNRVRWLRHGFSTRIGGVSTVYRSTRTDPTKGGGDDLNLGFTADEAPASVLENRRRFAQAVAGIADLPLVAVRQVHGTEIKRVADAEIGLVDRQGRATFCADGMMTAASGILLGIQAADCVPVLVADTRQRVVAAFHAGWRGTVAGIVATGVAELYSQFGSRPEDLIAAVGPAIGACCYTVGDEVRERFDRAYPDAAQLFARRPTGIHLDLPEANRRQLLAAGLPAGAIAVVAACTACARLPDGRRKFFSYRAEDGFTGRAMGAIGIVA